MDKEDIIMNAVFFGVLALSILLSIHMVNNDIEIDYQTFRINSFVSEFLEL